MNYSLSARFLPRAVEHEDGIWETNTERPFVLSDGFTALCAACLTPMMRGAGTSCDACNLQIHQACVWREYDVPGHHQAYYRCPDCEDPG